MNTQREEEAIFAAGHRERGVIGGEGFFVLGQEDSGLMYAGAQITGCRVLARVLPPLKRVVFAAAPPEIDLLPKGDEFYRRSQLAASCM
jgi:hypothetical protein